jgi:hypothetical protein
MMKLPMETIAHRRGIQSRYNCSVLRALIIRYLAFVITQEHHQSILSDLFCSPIARSTLMNVFPTSRFMARLSCPEWLFFKKNGLVNI